MGSFIENNWLTLLSIVIGLLVSFLFFRLQRKDVVSAREERLKHAHEELIDVIETYIINKQQLSEQAIENLVSASERSYKVRLRPDCDPPSLLQDVALRLQRSRHLDIAQKTEYAEKIEGLIRQIRESEELVFSGITDEGLRKKLETLESLVSEDNKAKAREIIQSLPANFEYMHLSRPMEPFLTEIAPALMAGFATIASLLALGTLEGFKGAVGRVVERLVESPISVLVPLAIVTIVLLQAIVLIRRIRRRTEEEKNKS